MTRSASDIASASAVAPVEPAAVDAPANPATPVEPAAPVADAPALEPPATELEVQTAFTTAANSQPSPEQSAPVQPVASQQPVQQPATEISPEARALFETAQGLGLSTEGIRSEAELANLVMNEMRNMQPMVNFAQQVLPYTDQIRQTITGQPGQSADGTQPIGSPFSHGQAAHASAQADPQPSPEANGFNPVSYLQDKYGGPAWKPEFQQAVDAGMVQRDSQTGLWAPAQGYELMVGSLLGRDEPSPAARSAILATHRTGQSLRAVLRRSQGATDARDASDGGFSPVRT